ncbi:hypothetical protein GF359_00510 [candidate division WOR-3 bacterium]|uniref:T9SS type A sorting domain-containing protein n=1 Tax=candidate division WOR-3 bacterium TaxID=2052148 RepID=A0A9D5QBN8_UNCW3|nr:hypothetical protein [candidate division WOR-3 bacterium]MBD3363674.1 hypothetical protein [candidate division WOR-3 bacterium]
MFLFVLSLITNSVDIPICTAPGDQLYPDVCWDGEAFWVVWQDGRDDYWEIYISKIYESGQTEEPKSVYSIEGNLTEPLIVSGSDTFCLTFHSDKWDTMSIPASGYVLLDSTGSALESTCRKRIYDAGPIVPVMCKDHFAIVATWGWDYGIEFPTEGEVGLLNEGSFNRILVVPGDTTIFPCMSFAESGVWNGERLLCYTSEGFIWLRDTLEQDPHNDEYFYPREPAELGWDPDYISEVPLVVATTRMDTVIAMIGRCDFEENAFYFDLIGKQGSPIIETPLFFNYGSFLNWYRSTTIAYGNGRFISVVEAKTGEFPMTALSLWGVEIDSDVTLLTEGDITGGPGQEMQPAISFGENHFLLVWVDNRNGNWDIYGRILDSLEYSGISESPVTPSNQQVIKVDKQVFSNELLISLSSPLQNDTEIEIRDVAGRTVREIRLDAGKTSCIWDGSTSEGSLTESGVYFISPKNKSSKTVKVVKF